MKLLLINGFILLICVTDFVLSAETFVTKKWAVKPHHAAYKKGNVAFQSNKGADGEATADRASLQSNINVEGKGDFNAKRDGKSEKVVAKNAKGITAQGDQSQKAKGVRTGDAGKHHGNLKNSKSGNDQNWNMDVNTGGHKMDTVMHGNKDSFDAKGSKGNTYNVDPASQTKETGKGVITRNGEKYSYSESRTAKGDVNAQMNNIGKPGSPASGRKTYTCQGQKGVGISNCVDEKGMKVGEVVEQPDGTVIVKKTIAKGVDVPVYKGTARKQADGKSVVTVNDGLFQAQAGNYKERDCMSDFGKSGQSKVKMEKPLTMQYSSESKDGRRMYQFPDCFTIGGKLTLPAGVDANRIAVQFDCSILPAGKLKCVDPGSCSKDCYYCNLCNNSRKADFVGNSNLQNACNAKGGGAVQISATICPPPEQFNKAICSGTTKADPTYWKRKGDVQCRVIFYERPEDEAALRTKYYTTVNDNSFLKAALKAQFAIDNKAFINANNPTDFDLCEFYIKKNAKVKEDVIGCVEGTTNYTMSGQKVRTDFLLEAGSLAAAPKSLFDTKKCPGVDQINQQQAEADKAAAKKSAPAGSNPWSSFFRGRREAFERKNF